MRKLKKRAVLISSGVAALFIAPLIVFAVLYSSDTRKNEFAPGSVDIEVKEGSIHSEELTKTLIIDSDTKSVDKPVEIKDTRTSADELLRASFIPVWYDSEGNVCDVFDFSSQPMQSGNSFTYTDGVKTITLKMISGWEQTGWSYSDPNADPSGDGCFYYTGALDNSKLTAQLLDSVELNSAAYALTEDYVFRLDVLADAIQSSGDAAATRQWNAP